MDLRDPKEVTITDGSGKDKKFLLSKFPAWDGLEIIARFPGAIVATALPKIADWEIVQELQYKILKYVAVSIEGKPQPLITLALIDNHVTDWQALIQLLKAEVAYNNGFFQKETISSFFENTVHQYIAKISEMLTQSSGPSSQLKKQASTNSGQSTP